METANGSTSVGESWTRLTLMVGLGVVSVAVGLWLAGALDTTASACALQLQFAGDIDTFRDVAMSRDCADGLVPRLWLDVFAASFYGAGLVLVCRQGRKLFRGSVAAMSRLAVKAAGVAVAADLLENGLALLALADEGSVLRSLSLLPGTDGTAEAIAAAALLKWAALALPVAMALAVVVTLVVRLGFRLLDRYADRYAEAPGEGSGWFARQRTELSSRFRRYRRSEHGLAVDVPPDLPVAGSTWERNYFATPSDSTTTALPRRGLCLGRMMLRARGPVAVVTVVTPASSAPRRDCWDDGAHRFGAPWAALTTGRRGPSG